MSRSCRRSWSRSRPRARSPSDGVDALSDDDQSQGHRHDVPVVQLHHVPGRRRDGDGHPRRAVPAGPAGRRSGLLQPDDHPARPHHGVRRDHAGLRRIRQLADPDDDRRAGHGVSAAEQLELLAAAAGGAAAGRRRCSCPGARPPRAGRSIRRSRPRSAWAWI